MAAPKLLHTVYSNTDDQHYHVFLFEAYLPLRDCYGTLLLKRQTKQKTSNTKLQAANLKTTKNNPTRLLHIFPLPSMSLFGVKEERKKEKAKSASPTYQKYLAHFTLF